MLIQSLGRPRSFSIVVISQQLAFVPLQHGQVTGFAPDRSFLFTSAFVPLFHVSRPKKGFPALPAFCSLPVHESCPQFVAFIIAYSHCFLLSFGRLVQVIKPKSSSGTDLYTLLSKLQSADPEFA